MSRLIFMLLMGGFVAQRLDAGFPTTSTHQVSCGGIEFTLPQGVTVTKVAGPPMVKWPIVADWDPQGRLVVAESGGVGWPIQEHNEQRLHRVVRLVDRDGDGTFDDRIVAADGLAFPEGVLCLGNDILVAVPPVILKLTDVDGDGRCEERTVWFDGKTVTNCANDLHGPYLGRDGWIYWCKGAFGEQSHDLLDGRTFQSKAAHVYRRRLAGGAIEPLISGGMDNPVEIAITESGDKFFTSTFLHHPDNDLRDGIGHAVYGSVFGKEHQVIEGHARTGDLMQPMIELGPAAPSGLLAATSHCKTNFGLVHQGPVLVSALFNLHSVRMHQLSEKGASYSSLDSELISTDRADFHPTDVIEDGRGNLLLIDTGGWYDLCCPTSRVDQKTAPGGIYRIEPIRNSGRSIASESVGEDTPNGSKMEPRHVFEYLSDPRPWIRRSAEQRLVELGDQSIPICIEVIDDPRESLELRRAAVWALCRLDSPASATALVERLKELPAPLLLPILHSVSIRRIPEGRSATAKLLQHPSMAVRRVAAQALGRIAGPETIRQLLDALEDSTSDRHLNHALTYAIIEIGRRNEVTDFVEQADVDAATKAALLATRELGKADSLSSELLVECVDREDLSLRSIALELLIERPEAVPLMMDRLRSAWSDIESLEQRPPEFLSVLLGSWRDHADIRQLIEEWYTKAPEHNQAKQLFLAKHLNSLYPIGMNEDRVRVVDRWVNAAVDNVRMRLLESLREVKFSTGGEILSQSLIRRALDSDTEPLDWLSAMPLASKLSDPTLARIVVATVSDEDSERALLAAKVLERVRLDEESSNQLLLSLDQVSARHLVTVIESIYRSGGTDLQFAMLEKLQDLPAARTLRDDYLSALVRNAELSVRDKAKEVSESLTQPSVDIRNTVDEVLAKLPTGDAIRGLQVFRGSKAACSSCHQMGYIGKNVGPVLTKIGRSRTAEALIEAILFPSSRLEQSYRSTRVLTKDGQVYNGLIEDRKAGTVSIRINADRVLILPANEIEREIESDISVMPSGMAELLTDQELADLLALLKAAK